ncbi:FISUMP domain-containing protein, partial [Culturomica massiliensis]|uniref:FISUMP domain-containing protein n=1 Tax=Culturomica massiliensis TaxID=1841857 RepID=UPI0023EC6118
LIDSEEGIASKKRYRTVEIGGKCWFADNLNRTLASGQSGAVKCYGDVESNCDTYGRLYNWLAATQNDAGAGVQGICPTGWHLPTNDEWIDLFATLGTTVDASNSVVDGKAIKGELNYWGGKTNPAANIGDNTIGFNAQPGGGLFYAYSGSYMTEAGIASRNGYNDIGERGWWWTSTTTGTLWSYWYSNSTGWSMQYMPYYVRMDEDGKVAFNINKIVNPSYASLTNTIFHSTVHHYILDNTSSNNGNALTRVRTNFYFSVRCVKD